MRRVSLTVFLATLISSIPSAYAAPGDLDTSFGSGGVVITDFGDSDTLSDVQLLKDGRIVAVGSAKVGTHFDFALARYDVDGVLETAFGGGDGLVTTAIGLGTERASSAALLEDGRIVVAGASEETVDGEEDPALVRYLDDGTLDDSFGGDGTVIVPFDPMDSENFEDVAVQPDGKIIAVGSQGDFLLVRLNTDGELDTDFGGTGIVTTPIGTGNGSARTVALQEDGKIVAAGTFFQTPNFDIAVARYTADGVLDPDFNGTGVVTMTISPGAESATEIVIQKDGKILLAGFANGGAHNDFLMVRLNPDGTPDADFGTAGIVRTDFSVNSEGAGSAVQEDGKILLGGRLGSDFAVARYNADGTLDTTFGTDGKATHNIATDRAFSLALQTDGKIILAGVTDEQADFILLRFLGDSADLALDLTMDPSEIKVGDVTTFTIDVTNKTAVAVGGVTVTDVLSTGLTLGTVTPTQGSCSGTTVVVCDLGTLAASGSAQVTLVVSATSSGTVKNTATVTAQAVDDNPSDNSDDVTVTVTAAPAASSGGCSLFNSH